MPPGPQPHPFAYRPCALHSATTHLYCTLATTKNDGWNHARRPTLAPTLALPTRALTSQFLLICHATAMLSPASGSLPAEALLVLALPLLQLAAPDAAAADSSAAASPTGDTSCIAGTLD